MRGALIHGHRSFAAEHRAANMQPRLNPINCDLLDHGLTAFGHPGPPKLQTKSRPTSAFVKNLFCRKTGQQPSRRNDLNIFP
jgi:hypothetical protein